MKYKRLFWILMAITTVLRLLIIGQIGLGDDEGHYFAFSQRPELSYFDHPPLIGLIIKLSVSTFGINEFAVRFPAVLLFLLTALFVFLISRELFGEKTAFWCVALLNVTPVFSFLGSVLTIPDA
ncbi:MAG: glycosyltransferase family 39 protein, partial [Pseudomonadota bacterium]